MAGTIPARSTVTTRGLSCALWTWQSKLPAHGLVVLFHGLGAHSRFPSVRIAAEFLASEGFVVSALDIPGHGVSPGLSGYIESAEALEIDGLAAARASLEAHPDLPLFLLGSSMG